MLYECKHYITDRNTIDQNINWYCVLEVNGSPDWCDIRQAIIIIVTATATATSAVATTLAETIFLCGLLRQGCRLRQRLIHAGMNKLLTVC